MPKPLLKRYLPHPDTVRNHRTLRWLGPWLTHPDLWHFSRRSVAGGVAVGFFFAFVLPVAQFLAAALLAIALRVNLPVALASTLITNPFTFAPWYMFAYHIGASVLGETPDHPPGAEAIPQTGSLFDDGPFGLDWLLGTGNALLLGLGILAVTFAIGGYLAVFLLWRLPARWRLWRIRHNAQRR